MNDRLFTGALIGALAAAVAVAQVPIATTNATSGNSATGATGGSAGSAAVGGTSASTIGVGATSGTSSAIATGGTAAAVTGRTQTGAHVSGNGGNGMARAQAMDRGTFSRSMTHTRIHKGQVYSRTRTMAHRPGSKPVISTSTTPTGGH